MTEEDLKKLLDMSDKQCADVLEKTMFWMLGGRANGKTVFKALYTVALTRAINKLRQPEVVYLCKYHKEPHYCKHTHRIEDALNFEEIAPEKWMEKERLQGKWIEGSNGNIKCNNCGAELRYSYLANNKPDFPKFCCDCGASMQKGGAE